MHQFLSAWNKKHCVREWELVSSTTRRVQWETRQTSVARAAEHQSPSASLVFSASLDWALVQSRGLRAFFYWDLEFHDYAAGEDLNVLLSLCEHSVRRGDSSGCCSPPCCLWPGYGPLWEAGCHPDAGLRLYGWLSLQTSAWEQNRWNGKSVFFPLCIC